MGLRRNARTTREAWRHYAVTGALPESVLREPIERAWRRCHQVGASPFVVRARELPSAQSAALFERERDLLDAARPYMQALSEAAGTARHAAMLGDRNAAVLDVVGDEESVRGKQRVPGPGALLSEAEAGANGIGSPLAEGGYIELVGPEHFIEGFHPFTCQGLPLYGPEGETVGVLSTSVRRVEASHRIREILTCAAHGIEAELMRRRLSDDLHALLTSRDDEARLLDRLQQDIVQLQGAARLRLETAIRLARSDLRPAALRLVAAATDLIRRFQRQSHLWREIATATPSAPGLLDLGDETEAVGALLTTEATVRGLHVEVRREVPIRVHADPGELRRRLFRAFLRAFDLTTRGHTVRAELITDEESDLGVVRFPATPEATLAIPRRSHIVPMQAGPPEAEGR